MGDLITEAGFPPGVINIVAATREGSERLVTHPDVDMVSFTGSVEVGKQIGKACGELIKPCVLELGGKSAAIVLDDADVDAVLPVLVGSSAGTSQGESCVCMSRILAPKSRYDEIAGKLTEAFKSLKVGDPREDDTVIGPLVTEGHRDRVLGYIKKAVDEGATVAAGGNVPEHLDKGWYVEATLLTNVTNDMTVAQEEIFGPVIALIPYEDQEDAVRIANDSRFGLSGSVFTGESGSRIRRRPAHSHRHVLGQHDGGRLQLVVRRLQGVWHRPGARPVRDRRVPARQDDLDRSRRRSFRRRSFRPSRRRRRPSSGAATRRRSR